MKIDSNTQLWTRLEMIDQQLEEILIDSLRGVDDIDDLANEARDRIREMFSILQNQD